MSSNPRLREPQSSGIVISLRLKSVDWSRRFGIEVYFPLLSISLRLREPQSSLIVD
jgi:hypothetical protein